MDCNSPKTAENTNVDIRIAALRTPPLLAASASSVKFAQSAASDAANAAYRKHAHMSEESV